jgi:hypothetical protein
MQRCLSGLCVSFLLVVARGAAAQVVVAQTEPADSWTTDPEPEPAPPPAAAQPPVQPPAADDPGKSPPGDNPPLAPLAPRADPTLDSESRWGVRAPDPPPIRRRILHGFRMGYLYVANHDKPVETSDPDCPKCSLKERYGMRTPHQFLIGYEIMGRLTGHGWLNVLLVGNVLVSGLEQSKGWPSANTLIGFEIDQSFQMGVGANFTLEEDKPAHMVMAAGWTPLVGSFYVPVHGFFVPDVDGNHRTGATVGVNW